MSREHIVSAALWEGPAIQVVGFPWCKAAPKTVSVASITAKILCTTHNNALSDVDAAGAAAFNCFKDAAKLSERRRKSRPRKWKVVRYEIDGLRLERWFLKTLINVSVSTPGSPDWAYSTSPNTEPPFVFVEAAFGKRRLNRALGLYAAASLGETIAFKDGIELSTLLLADGKLAGGLFKFVGNRFFLNLQAGEVPQTVSLPSGAGWLPSEALHHINRFNAKIEGRLSHYLHFLWNL